MRALWFVLALPLVGCLGSVDDSKLDPTKPIRPSSVTAEPTPSVEVDAGTTPPRPPSAPVIEVESIGETSISLRWTVSEDFSGKGIAAYEVLVSGAVLRTLSVPGYTDRQLAAGGRYCYQVRAVDVAGLASEKSTEVCATTYGFGEAPVVSIKNPASNASVPGLGARTVDVDATVAVGTVAQVELFDGALSVGVDTQAPFSIAWSGGRGGAHMLTARATTSTGAKTTSSPVTVTVGTAASPAISDFFLVDADTGNDLAPIAADGRIVLAQLPTQRITVRANTVPVTVGSVRFGFQGSEMFRVENAPPYCLFGRDGGGGLLPGILVPGTQRLTATPFTMGSGAGTAGAPLTLELTVAER